MLELRIGLLTHSVNPRGGVVHTLELAHALHDAGHRVTVMAPATAGQGLFRTMPCEVDLIPVEAATTDMADMVESRIRAIEQHLIHILQDQSFDVLHAQDPIGANALARVQDRGLIPGFVRTVHHLDHFDDPRLMAWQQAGFERASKVLCVSQLWRDVLAQEHGIDAGLVHNGVDCERYTPMPDETDAIVRRHLGLRSGAAPVFLMVGGVEARKNTLRILQAFMAVRASLPQAQLVIVGGASLLNHDAYVARFNDTLQATGLAVGPGQDVVITGPVPDLHMPALFRAADVLLMPSLREGFGLVVLEALASGTPVVVSRIAPFTEYLGPSDVLWCDPMDTNSMAEAMHHGLDPVHATTLARELPAVCRRFSWYDSAQRHLAVYRAFHILQEDFHARHALSPSLA